MNTFKRLLLITCLSLVAACQLFENEGQKRVRYVLKDQASAEFRNLKEVMKDNRLIYCGEVNAKNAVGGRTGFSKYVVVGRAVFMSDGEVGIYDLEATTGELLLARVTIHSMNLKTEIANIDARKGKSELDQWRDTYNSTDVAWQYYCM